MKKLVYINGYFLKSSPNSGVYRFAYNMLLALDVAIIKSSNYILVLPKAINNLPTLSNIKIHRLSGFSNQYLWEQISLPFFVKQNFLINFANFAPIFKTNQLCVIHDALVFAYPQSYSKRFIFLTQLFHKVIAKNSRYLATVSNFSASEIAKYTGVDYSSIHVLGNSAEHIHAVSGNESVLAENNLIKKNYVLVIFSQRNSAYKNTERILQIADEINLPIACVGNVEFQDHTLLPSNFIHVKNVDDAKLKILYINAKLLVLPSLYEGFGIPALEAMECGCPVVASDIPVFHEICGDAVNYFNPLKNQEMVQVINESIANEVVLNKMIVLGYENCFKFKWLFFANKLLNVISNDI